MKVLHIDSSINGDASISRKLSQAIVSRLDEVWGEIDLVVRDLAACPLPPVDGSFLAQLASSDAKTLAAEVLQEFMRAEVIVIGAPMYNFSIPAQLKAWIDYLCVAGVTFRYTENGPVGLWPGRKVYIASARGGVYTPGAPAAGVEHQESYLAAVLGFLGSTDIEIVRADGVRMGPNQVARAMANAHTHVAAIAA